MRRFSAGLMIAVLSLVLVSCSNQPGGGTIALPKSEAVLTGKIVQVNDRSILLAGEGENDLYSVVIPENIYNEGSKTGTPPLKSGQMVDIGFNGLVSESFPMQISKPDYINITGQGDDLIGFFMSVTDDLWNTDPGLNSEANIIAFDLSRVANMNGGEKRALAYLAGGKYTTGSQGILGTFDSLSRQGLIDKENLYFEKGLLFTFEVTDVTDSGFTFDASKWRSGTGAYYFNDCKAGKTSGGWTYTVGSQAIS